eukprot:CAMPEP_0177648810 /NCGR_PEP_ID=MMETSP0447-20121125/11028_1 /TAXON_ID=0 /ORGANISM="Stygamoeba regulata, Strain BSH-02190019" /LENGTH=88 /DNA_ID=CAMNT_0019151479 /DNA_START=262 /DNA_END=528 /DNA_ORIENTATION=+
MSMKKRVHQRNKKGKEEPAENAVHFKTINNPGTQNDHEANNYKSKQPQGHDVEWKGEQEYDRSDEGIHKSQNNSYNERSEKAVHMNPR